MDVDQPPPEYDAWSMPYAISRAKTAPMTIKAKPIDMVSHKLQAMNVIIAGAFS
nr:hypothetical protein [Candidatus Sigynarchaeota archaeon]